MSRPALSRAASRDLSPAAKLAGEHREDRAGEAEEMREIARLALTMAIRRYQNSTGSSPKACA